MKKHFKVGLRPVYYHEINNESFVFVLDWETGNFIEDFRYYKSIFSGPEADETTELTESEFNAYVKKIKTERGLN